MANRDWNLKVYDRDNIDYDVMQQFDQEIISISASPLWVYRFNLEKTLKDSNSAIDGLWNEVDMMNEEEMLRKYKEGFNEEFDPNTVRQGEEFDMPIAIEGYFQEPTWTNELSRMGFPDVEEELAITLNYKKMLADLQREIRVGDIIKTFRNKIYRVTSAYPADEVVGWKYMHYHVICIKVPLETIILPDDPSIPNDNNVGV